MRIYYNKDFSGMQKKNIKKWINLYKKQLAGSAMFTRNNSFVSKIVSWASKINSDEVFVPSHTASLILIGESIYVFDMKPPEPTLTLLEDYIFSTKDVFQIFLRDFELNIDIFSKNIVERMNRKYPLFSAFQSVFKKISFQWSKDINKKDRAEHCSEVHLVELQRQGYYLEYDANDTTPEDLITIFENVKATKGELQNANK